MLKIEGILIYVKQLIPSYRLENGQIERRKLAI
jgi:hypothetical protein